MEEKLIQTHITLLFYLILLFYLKNFTISFIDVPKKLFNYIKVYYSFLILLTILGFFSKLLVLIRIFITHNINKIFRLLLRNNVNFECIKNHIRFNKSRKKVNYKDEKKLITNVVYIIIIIIFRHLIIQEGRDFTFSLIKMQISKIMLYLKKVILMI
ncbi:hypothetical protein PFFCH_01429 [Plasmodium falciparum FCH/4]|uniref:Uncharacterized protein n=1 Tax=Plasmodium falciparum FCH/4 TaxID=1036724 RepID=A0A024VQR9_PLAFA|nr:hypothetical protein PFFCH_01429 [Plasmodium falciparum FCH/4]